MKVGEWHKNWDYQFEWTDKHLTAEQTRPLTFSYDTLASECLERLDKLSPQSTARARSKKDPAPGEAPAGEESKHADLYELLKTHADEDETLGKLWKQVNAIPEWVDWEQVERGQKVFYRYGGPTIIALTFQSLLGGMGSHRVVETLTRTGGFGVNVARRRLLETFQYLLNVTRDIDSVKPGGDGFAASIRVRFLHASVRRRIMQLAKQKPDYYDVDKLGVPANDLDCIGTVISFSATLIWVGLPRQGIHLRKQEIADSVAFWRWIAYVLGTPTDPFSTPELTKIYMESLIHSEIQPTKTSQVLANNIIAGLQDKPPAYASRPFLQAEAHWLNGHSLSDALNIPRPPFYYTALVAGQCLFFMALYYTRRLVPSWDEAGVDKARGRLHRITLTQTGGAEAAHEFKFVPDIGLTTTREGDQGEGRANNKFGIGVEKRNLSTLVVGSGVVGLLAWLCTMSLMEILRKFSQRDMI